MIEILLTLLAEFWVPIIATLGVAATFLFGRRSAKKDKEVEDLKSELEAHKRLKNVKTNTDRDAALERLHKSGNVRDD